MAMYAAIYAGDFSEIAIGMKHTHRNEHLLIMCIKHKFFFCPDFGK